MNIIARSISQIGVGYGPQHVARLGLFAEEQSSGRSGYWRLFFHQLQEKALENEREKPLKKEPKPLPVVELPDGSAVVKLEERSRKKAKVASEEQPEPTTEPNLFKPTPLVASLEPTYLVETMRLHMEVTRLFTSWQIPTIINRAQDIEDDELLLLLAA